MAFCCVAALALIPGACRGDSSESKVKRWAVEVLDAEAQAAPDVGPESVKVNGPAAQKAPETSSPRTSMAACELLVNRACEGLGPFSDECAEARQALPRHPAGVWAEACSELVDKYVTLIRPDAQGKKVNACRDLMILSCERFGQRSWQCKQTRGQINHLGKTGNREACVGDLLAWELKRVSERLRGHSTPQ